ncbi:MAG: glycosyltransferase, partial [Phycisphaerae bacterium]
IHLLRVRNDVPSILRSADVFVFPSRTEGLPNALMEAMAAGLPIVTTGAPGCRDLIQPGVTGLVVPIDDAKALAAAVQRLLSAPTFGDRLGAAARQYAERNLLLTKSFESYLEMYRTVLDSQ